MYKLTMKLLKDPLRTTIRGIKSRVGSRDTVKRIQEKICDYGVCSEDEFEYMRKHSDWDRVNPRRASNLG